MYIAFQLLQTCNNLKNSNVKYEIYVLSSISGIYVTIASYFWKLGTSKEFDDFLSLANSRDLSFIVGIPTIRTLKYSKKRVDAVKNNDDSSRRIYR